MKHGKLLSLVLLTAVSTAISASALAAPEANMASKATETYEIDPVHSSIGFKVKHLFSWVQGRFDTVEGAITLDENNPEASSVKVNIKAESINTANAKRDGHLKSADFFEVDKHPLLSFASKSVKRTGETTADVIGDLTMHGVTKEVPLKVEFLGKGPGMQGETQAGFQATTTLKRSDFGLTWGKMIEGTPLVGDEVQVNLEVVGIRKPQETAKP